MWAGVQLYLLTPDDGGRDGEEESRLRSLHRHRRFAIERMKQHLFDT